MSLLNYYPNIEPSLNLNFFNNGVLDSRITFTRPDVSASVIGSAVYYDGETFEPENINLFLYSSDFSNAAWVKTNLSVTANNDTAPDTTITADTLTASGANATVTQTVSVLSEDYTFSIWIKRRTGTGNIDLSCNSSGTWSTVSITSSWVRYSLTQTLTASTSATPGIRIVTSGDEIDVWGAQFENRSVKTAYTATTSSKIVLNNPVLVTASANTPRIGHSPFSSNPAILGLLIEESRTNLITYSSDFSNAIYVKTNCTVESNIKVSLDGTINADKLIIDNVVSVDVFNFVSLSITAGTYYTVSCYAKAGELPYLFLGFNTSATEYAVVQFNLSTGTFNNGVFAGTGYEVFLAQILPQGNGWYRCVVTVKSNNTTENVMVSPGSVNWTGSIRPGTAQTGNGYSGLYVWGFQVEEGKQATSYIATSGTSITRSADTAYLSNVSSWINYSEGTFIIHSLSETSNITKTAVIVDDNSTTNQIKFFTDTDSKVSVTTDGISQFTLNGGTYTIPASSFNGNSVAFGLSYINNSTISLTASQNTTVSDTGYISNSLTHLRLGSETGSVRYNGFITNILYYPVSFNANTVKKFNLAIRGY